MSPITLIEEPSTLNPQPSKLALPELTGVVEAFLQLDDPKAPLLPNSAPKGRLEDLAERFKNILTRARNAGLSGTTSENGVWWNLYDISGIDVVFLPDTYLGTPGAQFSLILDNTPEDNGPLGILVRPIRGYIAQPGQSFKDAASATPDQISRALDFLELGLGMRPRPGGTSR